MSVSRSNELGGVAGVVGGYAPLDSGLLIPTAYLPDTPAVSDSSVNGTQVSTAAAADLLSRTVSLAAGTYLAIGSYVVVTGNGYGDVEIRKGGVANSHTRAWASGPTSGNLPNAGSRITMHGVFTHAGGSETWSIRYLNPTGTVQFGLTGDDRFDTRLLLVRIGD